MKKAAQLPHFDSDAFEQTVVALYMETQAQQEETPFHRHRKCQLVMPLEGYVSSRIGDQLWMVPSQCAVWIPSNYLHCNFVSANARVCSLFVSPDHPNLPTAPCTLAISSLVKELILHLTKQAQNYAPHSPTDKLVDVLLHELKQARHEKFDFPLPKSPKLAQIAQALLNAPANRSTLAQWAKQVNVSERTLARLIKTEIGTTFGHWRGQLHLMVALEKLTEGESVQTTAEALGYESVSAFIAFFKKNLGHSPKQYLKRQWRS